MVALPWPALSSHSPLPISGRRQCRHWLAKLTYFGWIVETHAHPSSRVHKRGQFASDRCSPSWKFSISRRALRTRRQERVREAEGSFRPEAISAVSASAAVACAMVCRRLEFAVDCFKAAMAKNAKNIYLSHLFKRQRIFPHAVIYREGLLRAFDESALEKLYAGPDIQVLVTRTSPKLPGYAGLPIGLSLCAFRGLVRHRWCQRVEERLGLCRELIPVKHCTTPSQLADLVLASSCTPPFTPWYFLHG